MSSRARQELLLQVAPRYQAASGRQKSRMLDEFVASTGYARKYAIRLLHGPVRAPAPIQRSRTLRYGPAVREALTVAWSAAIGSAPSGWSRFCRSSFRRWSGTDI